MKTDGKEPQRAQRSQRGLMLVDLMMDAGALRFSPGGAIGGFYGGLLDDADLEIGEPGSLTRCCGRPFRPRRVVRRDHRAEALCFVRSGFQPGRHRGFLWWAY